MNTKTLIGFIVAIAVLGGAAYYIGRSPNGEQGASQPLQMPREERINKNWSALLSKAAGPPRGNPKAAWTLVECGDFECPNCGKAKPIIEKFVDQSGGRINLYFVNFPITARHKHAEEAAEASLAASAQGKFWPMYDMLYGDQDALVGSEIEYHASSIPGLNTKQLAADMTSRKYAPQVQDEANVVASTGINATPTFLLRSSSGGKVYAYVGLNEDSKYHQPCLTDLVQRPPWIFPPGVKKTTATKLAAKPPGA
jgi:protein-disulfide isomerase